MYSFSLWWSKTSISHALHDRLYSTRARFLYGPGFFDPQSTGILADTINRLDNFPRRIKDATPFSGFRSLERELRVRSMKLLSLDELKTEVQRKTSTGSGVDPQEVLTIPMSKWSDNKIYRSFLRARQVYDHKKEIKESIEDGLQQAINKKGTADDFHVFFSTHHLEHWKTYLVHSRMRSKWGEYLRCNMDWDWDLSRSLKNLFQAEDPMSVSYTAAQTSIPKQVRVLYNTETGKARYRTFYAGPSEEDVSAPLQTNSALAPSGQFAALISVSTDPRQQHQADVRNPNESSISASLFPSSTSIPSKTEHAKASTVSPLTPEEFPPEVAPNDELLLITPNASQSTSTIAMQQADMTIIPKATHALAPLALVQHIETEDVSPEYKVSSDGFENGARMSAYCDSIEDVDEVPPSASITTYNESESSEESSPAIVQEIRGDDGYSICAESKDSDFLSNRGINAEEVQGDILDVTINTLETKSFKRVRISYKNASGEVNYRMFLASPSNENLERGSGPEESLESTQACTLMPDQEVVGYAGGMGCASIMGEC